jgi:PAS domain S-box-containing protein
MLRYAIIASGWVFLGIYLAAEYREYGTYILSHITSNESLHQAIFHRAVLLAPVVSTFVGYVMKKQHIAEKNARESEERYREFITGTDNLVTTVDGEGKFVFVNQRAEDVFGISPKECLGKAAFSFIHSEDREDTRSKTGRLVRTAGCRICSGRRTFIMTKKEMSPSSTG